MNNNDFALFLDEIRDARNVTREDFVKDIISPRQYYRFIKGESTLKSDIILQLLERIELDNSFFYSYFQKITDDEFQKLDEIYTYLYQNSLKEAYQLYNNLDVKTLTSESNKKYYKFIEALLLHKQNKQNYKDTALELLQLIDYPDILSKNVLTYVEKNILMFVTSHLMKEKDYRIAKFFYNIAENEDKTNRVLDKYSIPFRTNAAKCLGKIEEHEKALQLLEKAEQQFITNDNYLPMINLYFFKAVEEKQLFIDKRYLKSLQNVFSLLNISENESYKRRYTEAIAKIFNLKQDDLVIFKA